MHHRILGKTGFNISELALGTWQVGGKWGSGFDTKNAERIIHTAIDNGINFIDTADVYESQLSEKTVGKVLRERSERVYFATKCGRRLNPHTDSAYTPASMRQFVEEALTNTGLETLDLIQLHCPPTETYNRPEIFGTFERLKEEGKILNLGVSVETIAQAMSAIEYDNVTTVQIIFNMFRLRPSEIFFEAAARRNVGVIVRVPLASGLLTGTYSKNTTFGKDDHRTFNRNGEAFDKGETFSGIPYEKGLAAVEAIKAVFPNHTNLAPIALKWTLMFPEVSCVIPGASRVEQVISNLATNQLPDLTTTEMQAIKEIYQQYAKDEVHHLW